MKGVFYSPCNNLIMQLEELMPPDQLRDLCQKHYIRKLSFFGSIVCNETSPQSNIDVLVEFEPGHIPGFRFFLIETELSHLLGRKVDLQTLHFLSPEIRESVLLESVPAYEQA